MPPAHSLAFGIFHLIFHDGAGEKEAEFPLKPNFQLQKFFKILHDLVFQG